MYSVQDVLCSDDDNDDDDHTELLRLTIITTMLT